MKAESNLEIDVPDSLIQAVLSQDKVDEPPHSFYKYPARFSPVFAREAIKAFTREGDTVIDPFCGGGTSLVEAIALGRRAAGFDISSLAVFLARAKTSPLSIHDKKEIMDWSRVIESVKQIGASMTVTATAEAAHYHRHLPEGPKEFFETVIGLSRFLKNQRQQIGRSRLLCRLCAGGGPPRPGSSHETCLFCPPRLPRLPGGDSFPS